MSMGLYLTSDLVSMPARSLLMYSSVMEFIIAYWDLLDDGRRLIDSGEFEIQREYMLFSDGIEYT